MDEVDEMNEMNVGKEASDIRHGPTRWPVLPVEV